MVSQPFSLLTMVLDSTAAGVSLSSTDAEKAAAGDTITQALASINTAVVAATAQVDALPAVKRSLALISRQATNPTALATLVENLLIEISSALNNVIASLGLSKSIPACIKATNLPFPLRFFNGC
jgi:hypothetical protein